MNFNYIYKVCILKINYNKKYDFYALLKLNYKSTI